ncbi:MAG: hypothetical protein HXY50_00030 [Ignavibacteriaceae bacterium]|nr:hypothetical protein [Ignavibacteriaceae bacterium]
MSKYLSRQTKILSINLLLLIVLLTAESFAQEQKTDTVLSQYPSHHLNNDERYSVFGPPINDQWKFQASFMNSDHENVSAFNFYSRNQRDKTLFLALINNGLENTNQYRVRQVSGGAVLFPFNNDDRYQLEVGGTIDDILDTSFYNTTLFSRFTYRPTSELWLRVGYEYFDGYELGHGKNPYTNSTLNSYYFAAKYKLGFFTPIGVVAGGMVNDQVNNQYGGGAFLNGPWNFYAFGGFIKSTQEAEDVRTLAIGRWTPFRPDRLPSAFFVWKHKSDYDFQLGGLFFGNRNLFIQPAAVGMITGMFISSVTLRVNSQLRQRKLLAISEDYENFDHSFFYVHLNQKINNDANNVGFTAFQFYKLFANLEFSIFSEPVIGLFYTEEVNPVVTGFNPRTFQPIMQDEKEKYFSYQIGFKIVKNFLFEAIHYPSKDDFTVALSYLIR